MKSNKLKTIYQDQRIAEEFCNFRCEYCEGFSPSKYSLNRDYEGNLTVEDEWFDKIDLLPKRVKKHFENGRKMENFYELSLEIIEKTKKILDSDILKLSGGEITTNINLVEYVKSIHDKYTKIQILTNGFNINENDIIQYKEMKNVSFQVSIDGATTKSNYAKSHSEIVTKRVLKNIAYMIETGIGVEINCVLTKYNTDSFLDMLERFKDASNFIVVPRPVRGEPKKVLNFSKEQILTFEKITNENFEKYSNILPPKAYMERLIDIMKQDKRNTNCYIPYFVQSIDGYGNFEKCPIGLITETTYNALQEKDLRVPKPKAFDNNELCSNCTNQYEMFNLYIEGKITKEELRKMPSLDSEAIISHIDEIKEEIIKERLEEKLKDEYKIKIERIEKNEQSTDGNVYIVIAKEKKYVIKVYENIAHTTSMIKLHTKLTEIGLNIPKVIMTKENKGYIEILQGKYCVVYSFMKGEQLGWNKDTGKLENDNIVFIARFLNKMHLMTEGINKFELPVLSFGNKTNRKSLLHFDLTRNNIFINQKLNNEIGIIDFDDAKYGDTVCDIAIFIANLFFSKTRGVDIEGMNKFIDKYYDKNEKLKEIEKPLIKEYALEWIDYVLNGHEFDTSTTESFEVRKKLIKENL